MEKEDCIFCKIVKGEIPSYKVFENEYIYAFLDIAKDCYGHTLVVPKQHYENIFDCDEKYLCEVLKATKLIANHYKNLGFDAVNIINASGKEAEQSVFHLHFHILPRKSKDGLKVFPTLPGTEEPLEKQIEKLKIN